MAARAAHVDVVVIENIHLDQTFAPGHTVYNWCRGVNKEIVRASRVFCPPGTSTSPGPMSAGIKHRGTGKLRASIRGSIIREGGEIIRTEVQAHTHYAAFVHGGTARQGYSYIYRNKANKAAIDALFGRRFRRPEPGESHKGWYMKLPPRGSLHTLHLRVHGQQANPFLIKGYNFVADRHEGLRRLPRVTSYV